jgi:triphosphatase
MREPDRELELKVDLTPGELSRLARHPKLRSGGAPERKALKSVYFDTPGYRLHARSMSLRVRDFGHRFVQTVKLDTDLKNGVSNSIEIEDPLDGPEPDPARIHDKHIRRKVEKAIRGSALIKAFETDVRRTTHRLSTRSSVIAVALDRGETLAMNRRSEICEAEIELIKGNPKDLLRTVQALLAKGSVRLSPASKAEKGYRLLLRAAPAAKAEPVRAERPAIAKGQACGAAFGAILRAAREQIVKNRNAVLETNDPEGAHQLRVGLTRLRTAQRALKGMIDTSQLREIKTDAQTLSRAAGRLRDSDVLIGEIYAPFARGPRRQDGFGALYEALQAHRAQMQTEARQALLSPSWSRLLLNLTLWPVMLERDPALQKPIGKYAGKALQKRWKKASKLGRSIASLKGDRRHKMRKSLKKLRYMVEFLAPLYPDADIKRFIKLLKRLQDIFGYVNDVSMAAQMSAMPAEFDGLGHSSLIAAGRVLGHHEAKVPEVWRGAAKAWKRMTAQGPFWN